MKYIPFLSDFVHLFYPNVCLGCMANHPVQGHFLCVRCNFRLPRTDYHLHKENPFTERFWGRIPLEAGAAMLFFKKKGLARDLIFNLKYKGRQEIGLTLGRTYGVLLRESNHFRDIDCIVPVPLHYRKMRRRGYNQSAAFGEGLSQGMEIPQRVDILKRVAHSDTQTRKGTIERLENVQDIFTVQKSKSIQGKHILLVDDVLTTGATLEACALQLLEVEDVRISIATIAMAVI
jgi:ComF family protein